jgi:serine/threonine protein kinase
MMRTWSLALVILLLSCPVSASLFSSGIVSSPSLFLSGGSRINAEPSGAVSNDPDATDPTDAYEIVRYIDQGRYSMVFEAIHTPTNSSVIIKVLKSGRVRTVKEEKEVEILSKLKAAPGIVQLQSVSNSNQSRYNFLVFDNDADGIFQPLSHHPLRGAPLSEIEVRNYFYLLLRAISSCHEHGIMHRDIKPRNIMINRQSGDLFLIDFGLRLDLSFYYTFEALIFY